MVIAHPVQLEIPLVVPTCDNGLVPVVQGAQVALSPIRVGNAHHPGGVRLLGAGGADVAAYADEKARWCLRRGFSRRPALGNRAHVQALLRIGQVHRRGLFIDLNSVPAAVPGSRPKSSLLRQGRIFRVVQRLRPGLVPKSQHTAHGHIHRVIRPLVVVPAVQQQPNNFAIHLHRRNSRMVVDGFQVIQAFVVIVNIE